MNFDDPDDVKLLQYIVVILSSTEEPQRHEGLAGRDNTTLCFRLLSSCHLAISMFCPTMTTFLVAIATSIELSFPLDEWV